ncbi:hypothetical protein RFW18_15415 [Metabacillus idriensis]|uniref:hypothetical protein n=1 Tax=Metabacillus idriensis TaxID=324768 RepID=UPI002813A119|nr:hypothetical protein [Metabacillus idriensis]MDR0139143.1 hypothetical protein [Metabacillus idriensis]
MMTIIKNSSCSPIITPKSIKLKEERDGIANSFYLHAPAGLIMKSGHMTKDWLSIRNEKNRKTRIPASIGGDSLDESHFYLNLTCNVIGLLI